MSRRFELYRYRDPGGVSGTGVVAHGCEFVDGSVSLRWLGDNPCTSVWTDIDSMLAVHGHLGASDVRYLDADPFEVDHAEPRERASGNDLVEAATLAASSAAGELRTRP
jgi:hypothetical protein